VTGATVDLTAGQARALQHAREVLADEAQAERRVALDAEWRMMLRGALRDVVRAFGELGQA